MGQRVLRLNDIKYVVQITHNLNGTHVSHECDMCGVNHTLMHYLDSTHSICTCVWFYMCACLHGNYS